MLNENQLVEVRFSELEKDPIKGELLSSPLLYSPLSLTPNVFPAVVRHIYNALEIEFSEEVRALDEARVQAM